MKAIQLLNPNGTVLQDLKPNATFCSMQLSHIAAGEYFVRIETTDGIINKKIIKQ